MEPVAEAHAGSNFTHPEGGTRAKSNDEVEDMDGGSDIKQLEERIKSLQRAVYYLVWKRSGFGEHCIHCNHSYPGHENKCKAAEVEQLIR